MKPPDKVPDAVIDSIAKSCGMEHYPDDQCKPLEFERRLRELKWSMDHYFFETHDMYVGVELDGYMHT